MDSKSRAQKKRKAAAVPPPDTDEHEDVPVQDEPPKRGGGRGRKKNGTSHKNMAPSSRFCVFQRRIYFQFIFRTATGDEARNGGDQNGTEEAMGDGAGDTHDDDHEGAFPAGESFRRACCIL